MTSMNAPPNRSAGVGIELDHKLAALGVPVRREVEE
jgi:hypothetical protein